MPELPDVTIYVERLRALLVGQPLERIRLTSPFVLRSVDPPPSAVEGLTVRSVERMGKRIVLGVEQDRYVVIHLMIAGRLRWKQPGHSPPRKVGLAAFDFPNGTLLFTEQGTRKRASLHIVAGRDRLTADHDRGGLEVLDTTLDAFRTVLQRENRTLKRGLTDPRLFSGIGNAYSDEILHAARLSPFQLTRNLSDEEVARLYEAVRTTLTAWIDRFRAEVGDGFPDKVTAFRPEMAVHGKFREPCPMCGAPIQRIVYAENEANYCATCQTGGRLLADRALSRLLKEDWPKTLEELENRLGE